MSHNHQESRLIRHLNVLMIGMISVWMCLGLAGCRERSENPVYPVEGRAALNYYDDRGRGEGVNNTALEEAVGIVALPDGMWRNRYRVDGY